MSDDIKNACKRHDARWDGQRRAWEIEMKNYKNLFDELCSDEKMNEEQIEFIHHAQNEISSQFENIKIYFDKISEGRKFDEGTSDEEKSNYQKLQLILYLKKGIESQRKQIKTIFDNLNDDEKKNHQTYLHLSLSYHYL